MCPLIRKEVDVDGAKKLDKLKGTLSCTINFTLVRINPLTLSSIYTHFNTLENKAVGKHYGKGEGAQNEKLTFFQNVFHNVKI